MFFFRHEAYNLSITRNTPKLATMIIPYAASISALILGVMVGADALQAGLVRRATPTLTSSIDVNDPLRGGKLVGFYGAMSNAFQLMNYAVNYPNPIIFAKYFDPGDTQVVEDVFRRLLGPDGATGAPELSNIALQAGEPGGNARAELDILDNPVNPPLILSEDAFVYPNRDEALGCEAWDDEGMTLDMYLLGSILLHEYVHWDWFLDDIHHGEIIDQVRGYGWEDARDLDKSKALYNADSYAWYATELFWSVPCDRPGYEAGD